MDDDAVIDVVTSVTFYLRDKVSEGEIGILECNIIKDEAFIKGFSIVPHKRGQGFGTKLLNNAIKEIKEKFPLVTAIELDDMTDRYLKSDNIYCKFGFRYVDIEEGPEMILYLSNNLGH